MKHIKSLILSASLLGGGCLYLMAQTPVPEEEVPTEETFRDNEALALSAAEAASEGYKRLKITQYDGVTEVELFPMVLDVHREATAALENLWLPESDKTRMRSILFDLDPLVIQGAVFYSAEGNLKEMNTFARACVDTRMRPDMRTFPFTSTYAEIYPQIIYTAAQDAYNSEDYDSAIGYFQEYLRGNDNTYRQEMAQFLGQAAILNGTPGRAVDYLVSATNAFPANYNLLMTALNVCLQAADYQSMQPLVEKALALNPDDQQLLSLQARLFEDEGNYSSALDIYSRLYELNPTSLDINRHLAMCYFNLGTEFHNKAVMESDEKAVKRFTRQSKSYFQSAAPKLALVVDNDPTDVRFVKALAMAYASLGDSERLNNVNTRLVALGEKSVNINGMPEMVTMHSSGSNKVSKKIPDYQDFAKEYVETNLAEWSKRGEFEKMDEFNRRMNQANVNVEYERLCREAEADYLKKYSGHLRVNDLQLERYDIDNESYLIKSDLGDIVIHVPHKNKEAETFKNGWNGVQLRNLKFYIRDNRPAIAYVDFVTPGGKTYTYNAENAANYDFTEVKVDLTSFLAQSGKAQGTGSQSGGSQGTRSERVIRAKSDVDKDIPVTSRKAENLIAVIWANENYDNVAQVPGALNDGEVFAEYCAKTLGIPESQIYFTGNATYAQMVNSISNLKKHVGALGDGVDVIFYYAGHGIPDDKTKDAFLIPADGTGSNTETMYPMKKLYSNLAESGAENVMVFLDACFSGAQRGEGMIVAARGIARAPQEASPEGSMFVLSAASGDETAMPYREKNHGMFTYFLLKKLQESKGNVTLKELSEYIKEQVKKNSIAINHKSQTPSLKVSGRMSTAWGSKKLRP